MAKTAELEIAAKIEKWFQRVDTHGLSSSTALPGWPRGWRADRWPATSPSRSSCQELRQRAATQQTEFSSPTSLTPSDEP